MKGILLGAAGAAFFATAALAVPSSNTVPASHNALVNAQLSIQVGPNHSRWQSRRARRNDNCRSVTTTRQLPNGRMVTRTRTVCN